MKKKLTITFSGIVDTDIETYQEAVIKLIQATKKIILDTFPDIEITPGEPPITVTSKDVEET